ncbi:MAG: metallophosphoesterase, partial [Myxococcales bacterium]|nr:metallophosphoesterase [Myxococcales bacterium]
MGDFRGLGWLHVSDLHLHGGDRYDAGRVLDALVECVRKEATTERRPDVIFVTGDVAQHGQAHEYRWATALFDALLEAAGLAGRRERLWVVPGNHDVDREEGAELRRTLADNLDADRYFGPGGKRKHFDKLRAYREWYDGYFEGVRRLSTATTCGPAEIVEVEGVRLGVLPVDTALFCQDDADHGQLWVGRRCVDEALAGLEALEGEGPADLWVALMHHPLSWLHYEERGEVQRKLRAAMDVLLRGHLHEAEAEQVLVDVGGCLQLAAGASYQGSQWPNRALLSRWDGHALRLHPVRYVDSRSTWTLDTELFPDAPDYEGVLPLPGRRMGSPAPEPADAVVPTRAREELGPFPGDGPSRRGGYRRELVVEGRLDASGVHWSFRTPDRRAPYRVVGPRPVPAEGAEHLVRGRGFGALGQQVGEALFGRAGEEDFHEVFRGLFGTERLERPGPAVGPVRCRLLVDDPALVGVPWRLAADRGHWLTDEGWTFELSTDPAPTQTVQLPNPCSIALVAPTWGALGRRARVHERMVEELLEAAWPGLEGRLDDHLAVVRGLPELERQLERLRPHVVVVLGHHVTGPPSALRMGSAGSVDRVPLEHLVDRLQDRVQALYLATEGQGPLAVPPALAARLPCVIAPTAVGEIDDVIEVLLAWLHGLLVEALDPVEAMHQRPAVGPSRRWAGMRAHTGYFAWSTAQALALPIDGLAQLRMDRDTQRALFVRHVDELLRDPSRRVESVIAFGSEADRPELLGPQLKHELDEREPAEAVIVRQGVPLPPLGRPVPQLRDDLRRLLHEELDARQGEELAAADGGLALLVVAHNHLGLAHAARGLRGPARAERLPGLVDGP